MMLYVYQWLVLLVLCPPLLALNVVLAVPLALLLWLTGAVELGKQLAAQRDPVLAKVLEISSSRPISPYLAALASFGRVYVSLVAFGLHGILRLFVTVGRPKTVFVVYLPNYHLISKFFCVGTAELIYRTIPVPGPM